MTRPKVLLLDEPTEGIQPSIIKDMARTLNRIKEDYEISHCHDGTIAYVHHGYRRPISDH